MVAGMNARRQALAFFLALALAACQSSGPAPSGAPSSAAIGAQQTAAASTGPAPMSASPTTPVPIAVWVGPLELARLASGAMTLSVKPGDPAGVLIASVRFTVSTPASSPAPACTAKRGSADGTWSCRVDLVRLGAVPGPLDLGFDVTDRSGAVSRDPDGVRTVTYAVAPPQPTDPTYVFVKETMSADKTESIIEYRATWKEPAGFAREFRIYELTACLRMATAKTDGMPCVSKGMAIPKSSLRLITTLSGDARSARIQWPGSGDGLPGPGPGGVLIRASNDYGDSIFTIMYSDTICYSCVY